MRRILIAGCGYVGAATADLFHANGWAVEGWTGSVESELALRTKPFRVQAVDITNASATGAAASQFDAVIQCVSSRGGDAEVYREIYLRGAENLARAFPDALLLFTSSTSVYAQQSGEWVTELSAAKPSRAAARVLRETEDLVLAAGGVVARLAGIYGPGRSALLRKFLKETATIDARRERFINQVHRDDIAAALFRLVETHVNRSHATNAFGSRIFNVADNHPWTERECYEWLGQHFDRPVPPTTTSPAQRKRGDTNKRVSAEKLLALGWSPQFPDFAAGMARSVLPQLAELGA